MGILKKYMRLYRISCKNVLKLNINDDRISTIICLVFNSDVDGYKYLKVDKLLIYEVVTGQILLNKRQEFYRLHNEFLLPVMNELQIKPLALLVTELGAYGKFLDIYEYASLSDYDTKSSLILKHPGLEAYYRNIGECIHGSISIEIMKDLPYAKSWAK